PDLELDVEVARHVPEELVELHLLEVDTQGLLEGGKVLVRDEVDALRLAKVEDDRLERGVLEVDRDLLLKEIRHSPAGRLDVKHRLLADDGLAVVLRDVRRVLDLLDGVAHVLPRRQTAILLLSQETRDGGVEDGVLGVDLADLVLDGLGAAEATLLKDP